MSAQRFPPPIGQDSLHRSASRDGDRHALEVTKPNADRRAINYGEDGLSLI